MKSEKQLTPRGRYVASLRAAFSETCVFQGLRPYSSALYPAFKPPMHNLQKDWISSVAIAALGAGVITSFAVAQGQNPLVGLAITAFAAVSAVAIDHFL